MNDGASTISIDPAPEDGVTRVKFSGDGNSLLCSTWAGTLCVHATQTGALRYEAKRYTSALLDAGWHSTLIENNQDDTTITNNNNNDNLLATALDGSVLFATRSESTVNEWQIIGKHENSLAARCLVSNINDTKDMILTGGWDETIRLWDIRSSPNCSSNQIESINTKAKIFGACKCGSNRVIFISSDRHVRVIDIRKPLTFLHDRTPPTLAYQLRGISAPYDGSHYVVGSTEGRVAVEWFDHNNNNNNNNNSNNNNNNQAFSFRCHRIDGLAFPVNCITHNRKYESFATGGGDGHVAIWDGYARKRITQFNRFSTSIASIDFDSKSQYMAVAVSYTFEEGEKDHPPDEIVIRKLEDVHIATKQSREEREEREEEDKNKGS